MPAWRRSTEIDGWGTPPWEGAVPSAGLLLFPDRARRGAGAVERGGVEILASLSRSVSHYPEEPRAVTVRAAEACGLVPTCFNTFRGVGVQSWVRHCLTKRYALCRRVGR
jgi:hypothetical protein